MVYVLTDPRQIKRTDGIPTDTLGESSALISAEDELIETLCEQLVAERRSNVENRKSIAALTQRILEIEAPREERESSVEPADMRAGRTRKPQSGVPGDSASPTLSPAR